jgi:hypothetical protein
LWIPKRKELLQSSSDKESESKNKKRRKIGL